jgi:hypothetical protein
VSAITVTVRLTPKLADMLRVNSMRNFYADQPDRFAPMDGFDSMLPNDPAFADGTMHWCETAADALLLLAYEHATGRLAILLGDEADTELSWVVLTDRPWAEVWGHPEADA